MQKSLIPGTRLRSLFLLACSLLASGAHAGPILQPQSSGFSQILIASPFGQTFTAEDAAISTIGFLVTDINTSAAPSDTDLIVRLYAGGLGASGPLLQSSVASGIADDFDGWVDFDFSGVMLTVGAVYSAMLVNDTSRWGVFTNQHSFSDGTAVPGRADYVGGDIIDVGNVNPLFDTTFRVLSVTSVSEPASALLVGFGLIASLLVRHRR